MIELESNISPLINTIMTRRSIRRYQDKPIPQALIESIITAALWAPSAHNRQPWRFVAIQNKSAQESLALAMGNRLRQDLQSDAIPQAVITKDVQRSYQRLTSAPVLILVCLSMLDMDVYSDNRRNENEYIMAVQSTAMAGQNILLAAHNSGLGACWLCAPLFCPEVVIEVLDLPEDWQPQGLIAMGYPAQEREKTREPLESRIIWR